METFIPATKLEATEKPMWHLIHDGVHVLDVHRTSGAVRNQHLVVRFSSLVEVKNEIAKLGLIAMPDRPQKVVRKAGGEVFNLGLYPPDPPEPVTDPVTQARILRRIAKYVAAIPVVGGPMEQEREAINDIADHLALT
jgi:hypothetical protein